MRPNRKHFAPAGRPGAGGTGPRVISPKYSYSAAFDSITPDQNPIVDDGNWLLGGTDGLDWTNAAITSGVCKGTQDNTGAFDDSFTIRKVVNCPNQKVRMRLRKSGPPAGLYEVEALLRGSMSAHNFTAYECFFARDGSYIQIVRHKGAFGQFEYIADFGADAGAQDLDWYEAQIVGDNITMTLFQSDGVTQRWQYTCDITVGVGHTPTATISSGSMGMGYYIDGASGVYGADRWVGTEL